MKEMEKDDVRRAYAELFSGDPFKPHLGELKGVTAELLHMALGWADGRKATPLDARYALYAMMRIAQEAVALVLSGKLDELEEMEDDRK